MKLSLLVLVLFTVCCLPVDGHVLWGFNDLNELLDVEAGTNVVTGNIRVPVSGFYGPTVSTDQVATITVQLDGGSQLSGTLYTNETWELFDGGARGLSVPADSLTHTVLVEAITYGVATNTKSFTLSYEAATRTSYAYDSNGNLVQKTIHASQPTVYNFDYDALNRMISATRSHPTSDTLTVEYVYDPFNRRIDETVSTSSSVQRVRSFLWDGQSEIGSADTSGSLLQLRALGSGLGNDIGAAVGVELRTNAASAWTVYVPVHDQRGNVVLLLNHSTGAAVEYYRYDAFGNVERFGTDTGNPWLFSSKRLDSEFGFIYFNRRYYDPETGRFITTDPLGYADGFNRYVYVGNNPLVLVDPWGLLAKQAGQTVSAWADANWDLIDDDWHYMPTMNYLDYEGRWVQATLQNSLFAPAWNFVSGAMYPVTDVMYYGSDSSHAVFFFIATHPEVAMQVEYTMQAVGPLVRPTLGRIGQWFRRAPSETPKTTGQGNYLYQKVGPKGEHLKYGITKNPATRYTKQQLGGGKLRIVAEGSKKEMLSLERSLHKTLPIGPEEGQLFYIQKQVQQGLKPPPYGN